MTRKKAKAGFDPAVAAAAALAQGWRHSLNVKSLYRCIHEV